MNSSTLTNAVLLDTHVWIWWASALQQLSIKAQNAISSAIKTNSIYISAISAWEVALLVQRQRLVLTMNINDWIAHSSALPYVQFIPVDVPIAIRSVDLPGNLHKDPADRIIISTALRLGLPLITCDESILAYQHVKTIW